MKPQKHEGNLKARLAQREVAAEKMLEGLKQSTKVLESKAIVAEQAASVESIALYLKTQYSSRCIREIDTFNRSLKSKDRGKVMLAVATHLFAKYKVPAFMQECWYTDSVTVTVNRQEPRPRWQRWEPYEAAPTATREASTEIKLRRDWYITQASGGSLFKERCKGILTKNEVHAFLNCPLPCNFREAIIYAIVSQHGSNLGVITRIMKCKLNQKPGVDWINGTTLRPTPVVREMIKFFYDHPELTLDQINDLIDYIEHANTAATARREVYSLKGRNLHSLSRQMQDWHYELARVKRMGNAKWEGIPIADSSFELPGQPKVQWSVSQVKTSKDLAAEGTAMHHCVYSYQARCISGVSSIWSLCRHVEKRTLVPERALTLEIDENGRIIQIRGIANRAARADELEAVRFWARQNQLTINRY